jgi:hypothetical protein
MSSDRSVLEAIQRETGAPAWLCNLCWDACAGDPNRARQLVLWAFKLRRVTEDRSEETARLRAKRMISTWLSASAEGFREAEADIRSGKLLEMSFGLVRGGHATCPKCLVRWEQKPESYIGSTPPSVCPGCKGTLIPLRSLGCLVSESTEGRVEGYNRAVEMHLGATAFPGFSWVKVKSSTM